jgi:hypothetical protein
MKQAELALLIKNGAVERVVIFRARNEANGWQIFAYGEDGSVPGVARDWMEPARETQPRTWASLDTAHAWMRTMGWNQNVTVDG